MKVLAACLLLALGVSAQEAGGNIITPKTATRMLRADVLRDAPGFCFGSTTLLYYEPGTTWNLGAFCGQATCVKNDTGLFEEVQDCGPAPKPNDLCVPVVPDPRSPFPECCPKFDCQQGAKLVFPTEEEIRAEVQRAREEAERQRALLKQEAEAAGQAPTPQA